MARVLIIAADGSAIDHLDFSYFRLLEEGLEVTIAAPRRGVVKTSLHWGGPDVFSFYIERPGYVLPAHLSFDEVDPTLYDGLVIPGGRAPEYLRNDKRCLAIVRHFLEAGKPITSLCHGPLILLAAGVRGRRLTCSDDAMVDVITFKNQFIEAKGEKEGEPDFVVDDNLVTARGWWHYHSWIREFLKLLAERGVIPPKRKLPPIKVLILAGEHSSAGQLSYGYERMVEEGFEATIAAPTKIRLNTIVDMREEGWNLYQDYPGPYAYETLGFQMPASAALDDVDVASYDALLIPGGRAPEYLREYSNFRAAIKHFIDTGKPVGSICTGPRMIVTAGVKSRRMTCIDMAKLEIGEDNEYVNARNEAVVDGNLVTVSGRPYYHVWIKAFLEVIEASHSKAR